ncbi:hypothetical protein BCR34DRAFT_179850 [Clohesyomyces aquaticus]|uniref:Uncharacterized protein n=1 Tax=Clohesyomyces aquaticus TaxID=1231657 RepID=A0A1Y1YES0_9PLEO|nr:hypothetical protein BCR34DRAFT_179850 [Clohesyomyces aquaticus]
MPSSAPSLRKPSPRQSRKWLPTRPPGFPNAQPGARRHMKHYIPHSRLRGPSQLDQQPTTHRPQSSTGIIIVGILRRPCRIYSTVKASTRKALNPRR